MTVVGTGDSIRSRDRESAGRRTVRLCVVCFCCYNVLLFVSECVCVTRGS